MTQTLDLFSRFPPLDLLLPELKVEESEGGLFVFDLLRKQRLVLTPEEWVRQHVVHWLLTVSKFPATLLSIERKVNGTRNRADVVAYNREGQPILLVECKAPTESITSKTATQALAYNQKIGASTIWLTNGLVHQVLSVQENGSALLPHLPEFTL